MQTRRAQKPITIRSDRAADRLAVLTRDGRSQAQVIEDALDRMPVPGPAPQREPYRPNLTAEDQAQVDQIMALVSEIDGSQIPTMAEFDAMEYDENGLPR